LLVCWGPAVRRSVSRLEVVLVGVKV